MAILTRGALFFFTFLLFFKLGTPTEKIARLPLRRRQGNLRGEIWNYVCYVNLLQYTELQDTN